MYVIYSGKQAEWSDSHDVGDSAREYRVWEENGPRETAEDKRESEKT